MACSVRVQAGCHSLLRLINPGDSYQSSSDPRAHFGLGSAVVAERIEIRWPSGARESLSNVGANQIVTIVEGKGITRQTRMTAR